MKDRDYREKCLSDDEVAGYVDGVVKPEIRKRIEDHLPHCSLCLHHVAELKQLVGSEATLPGVLPAQALARAESLIASETQAVPEFAIALALKSGICKLLETTGDLLAAGRLAPVALRGDRPQPGESSAESSGGKIDGPSLRVAKSLSGHLVTLELVAERETVLPKLVIVEETSSARPDGIKAKIYSPGTSETRYSRQGRITFSALKPGVYGIDIEEIGRVRLDIQ
jgi:hypothetical protein